MKNFNKILFVLGLFLSILFFSFFTDYLFNFILKKEDNSLSIKIFSVFFDEEKAIFFGAIIGLAFFYAIIKIFKIISKKINNK